MSELAESLGRCKVDGNTVYLPPISEGELSNYPQVKKALLNAGAKYKKNSFVFSADAQPFIDRLMGNETINIKKEFQYFPTPDDIADYLVELAEIRPTHSILEPSAGQGSIIKAIERVIGCNTPIDCYELMPENQNILIGRFSQVSFCGEDFLKKASQFKYDRIIANPPFSKNQDIDHIMQMYDCLALNGRIVTIASKHWTISDNRKEKDFRLFLESVGAELHNIEAGKFKESGTMVSCCILVIQKTN